MKLFARYDGDSLTLQPKEYQDDGWFIIVYACIWTLYEIPVGGGITQRIGSYGSISEALEAAEELS